MGTDLTGSVPSSFYKDLVQVPNSNSGFDTTLRQLESGNGNAIPVYLSTTKVLIKPSSDNTDAYVIQDSDGNDILEVDTTNKKVSINNSLYVNGINIVGSDSITSTNVTGATTIDLNNQVSFWYTLTGNTTFSFNNGDAGRSYIFVIQPGDYTVTLPSTIKWPSGILPTFTTDGIDILSIFYISETVQLGNAVLSYEDAA